MTSAAGPCGVKLERFAVAAYLTGREDDTLAALERAHQAHVDDGEVARAVRCACWLGVLLLQGGCPAQGGGWLARARALLSAAGGGEVEEGYLLLPMSLRALGRPWTRSRAWPGRWGPRTSMRSRRR